ncbi:Lrp/AsnC family transcriptional regulator [Thalassotalea sp. M1531]|uniref:Lrp/AsnC family transcriptional regulator n=1 Tax=Thalassotalea algicola TaxID=2716224 RepID=A0A7Y0LBF5_9GAMM|nr:Lrp/AsnC family transcriptional regulator [Thalassotalea algicola]NMP31453.1 Lrp/AsnC family transcriptional regulator [Thalassotalea algicola]
MEQKKLNPHRYDVLDQSLIALLRADARASVSFLAKKLGVSRSTVQNRIDKLVNTGGILGFTIRAHQDIDQNVVRAVMMIEVVGRSTAQVIQKLRGIPELAKLHTTNGKWDLVAEITTTNLTEFDRILRIVREIEGIIASETSILLTSI